GGLPFGARKGRGHAPARSPPLVTSFLLRRLMQFLIVVVGVLTIVFLLQRLSVDRTNLLLPVYAPESVRADLRHQLGLDQPLVVQYVKFLGEVVRGNLGESYRFRQPALELVLERFPATLLLAGASLLLSLLIAL